MDAGKRSKLGVWLASTFCALLLAYPLSWGPLIGLAQWAYRDDPSGPPEWVWSSLDTAFVPIGAAIDHSPDWVLLYYLAYQDLWTTPVDISSLPSVPAPAPTPAAAAPIRAEAAAESDEFLDLESVRLFTPVKHVEYTEKHPTLRNE